VEPPERGEERGRGGGRVLTAVKGGSSQDRTLLVRTKLPHPQRRALDHITTFVVVNGCGDGGERGSGTRQAVSAWIWSPGPWIRSLYVMCMYLWPFAGNV
jgi:hypothetical protein